MITLNIRDWRLRGRHLKAVCSKLAAPCVAVMLCLSVSGASAETPLSDFLDPLEDIRGQLQAAEKKATTSGAEEANASAAGEDKENIADALRSKAADATDSANASAKGLWGRIQESLSSVTGDYKIPMNGLLGILGLCLMTVAALIAWPLFRRRKVKATDRIRGESNEIYASGDATGGRPVLDSGAHASRRRREAELENDPRYAGDIDDVDGLDYHPQGTGTAGAATAGVAAAGAATAATAAAGVAHAGDYDLPDADVGQMTDHPMAEAGIQAQDPDTWQRPNLDRLKSSIREDWQEDGATETQRSAFEEEDAQAFADLFGDDEPPVSEAVVKPEGSGFFGRASTATAAAAGTATAAAATATAAAKSKGSTVLDMLDTYEERPETASADELRSATGAYASETHASNTETPDPKPDTRENAEDAHSGSSFRSEALRRVRALRDSVQPT